ncbi:uncharacterized protein LOC118557406 [Fundulus heteroclitus]|uniref:uncharacterized protein LOC118557406 n=1 Tax=Fundulus heteroclitus TaxID=8078 RepID=UPI00165B5B3F|nr:uncharacterized protein LOC118557406 [Fundulus heteroclitus]
MAMVRGLAAFVLLSIMSVIETIKVPDIALIEAGLGQTVTLNCNAAGFENGLFFWYKMNYGYMVQTVATGSFGSFRLHEHFNNTRFEVKNTGNMHYLTIRNVSKEDEATYLCQAGAAYKLTFVNGTNLAVNDSQNKKSSYVKQTSGIKSVSLGTQLTLQCSLLSEKKEKENMDLCTDEHKVFWFRAESESNPGFIYADKKRCNTQAGGSCEYRLSKTIQSPSDTGTYYCAVVICGEILFGEGTKVETRQTFCLYAILLSGLLACSILVNITLILKRRNPKRLQEIHKDVTATTLTELDEDQPCNMQDGEEDGMNYVALNFPSRKPTRWKSKRETSEDCTYSNINPSIKGSVHQ